MAKKIPNPVDQYVGSRVRARRLAVGMSQGKLADALHLTFQQVQKYEKGVNRISSSRLTQIATALKVPVMFFFEGGPDQRKIAKNAEPTNYVRDFINSQDGIALIRAFRKISNAKLRRSFVTLVENIADQE
jgi:transcriptional regulator with XRE-family HTH domain